MIHHILSLLPRFLHRSDHLNLNAPIAELLSGGGGKGDDDGEPPKEIGMEALFEGLPQTKKNKKLRKALTAATAAKDKKGKKGKKKKKGGGEEEEDDKEEERRAAKDLRLPAPLTTPQQGTDFCFATVSRNLFPTISISQAHS